MFTSLLKDMIKKKTKKKNRGTVREGVPGGSMVKNPPAMKGMQVQSLDQEDSLEKETATHPSILDWEIPGQRSLWDHKRVRHDLATKQQQIAR